MNRALWVLLLAGIALPQTKSTNDLGSAKLLVASRDLADPNFTKTVILLVHDDDDKVLGLILNRRTDVTLSTALPALKAAKGRADRIYTGGPVNASTVFAMLQSPAKVEGAPRIFDDVYLILTRTLLEQTIAARRDPGVFHIYLGYAGWTGDQLRREVELGAWFVFPADAATVFDSDPDTLWPRMIRKTEQKMARFW
jgi:putative transcriptional regulator